jgi:RNA polymerase sigma-70 factor (ECF subfamily)
LKNSPSEEGAYADLCRRIRAGQEAALSELFEQASPALLRYARGLTGREDFAQDAVQHAFIQVWKERGTLRPDRSLKALLYTTVRHRALKQMRNKNTRSELATENLGGSATRPSPAETTDAGMLGTRIHDWIGELPERRREAFRLSRFDQLSYREIAEVMDVSVRTVESHVRHALQHLRDRLETFEPERLSA